MAKKEENLVVAKYGGWQASLWGACFIAFALGALPHKYFGGVLPWVIIIVGVALEKGNTKGKISIQQVITEVRDGVLQKVGA